MHRILIYCSFLAFFSCNKKAVKAVEHATKSEKANILFIMCDDLTTQAISAYGGIYKDLAPTPNIDRIAKEGMLFQNVLCTNAICGPSRAAILTGNYNHVNGFIKNENGGQFNNKLWTFPQELQKNGYSTSLFGKWHLGSTPVGFDNFMYHVSSGQQGFYWNPVYNQDGKDIKTKGYATNLTTDAALEWLDKNKTNDKPFMMMLQYKAPHRPWEPDTKYENLWDEVEFPYPATFNDNYKTREKTAGDTEMTMHHLTRRDLKMKRPQELTPKERTEWDFFGAKNGQAIIPEGMTLEEAKKWKYQIYIKDYLACVKSVDDNIGRVLEYLTANNLEQNTIIILTSDQGFYLGDHGWFDKRWIYEESIRMPFIMKYPKKIQKGSENRDVISNIDFAPTILQLAGVSHYPTLQGRSFAHLLDGTKDKKWRQSIYYHYYEFPYWHHVQPHYGIRNERYTLAHFYHTLDTWEFYDRQTDPHQLYNAINDPRYTHIVATLKSELKQLQKSYNNDKPLEEFRKLTNLDMGKIHSKKSDEEDVQSIIQGSRSKQ